MRIGRVLRMYREVSRGRAWLEMMELRATSQSNLALQKNEKIKDGLRRLAIQEGRIPDDVLLEMKRSRRNYFQRFDIVAKEVLDVLPDQAMFNGRVYRPPGAIMAKKHLKKVLKQTVREAKDASRS